MGLAIVTGSNVGLGYQASIALAKAGHDLVITSRNFDRGDGARKRLRQLFPERRFEVIKLDLSKRSSVDDFAATFSKLGRPWDILINNAGAKVLPAFKKSEFDCEYHFGANAVGHFAITSDLMPFRSGSVKVVSVASIVAHFAPKELGPIGSPGNYDAGKSYAASKLSNLLFALELDSKYRDFGVRSLAAHPGFARAEPYGSRFTAWAERMMAQSAENGAKPIVAAALGNHESVYLGPKFMELWGDPVPARIPSAASKRNQDLNWKILSELSGRDFQI